MSDRAYTVAEIDALRFALKRKLVWGRYTPVSGSVVPVSMPDRDMRAAVEDMVRTHMLAGHTAEDLMESEPPINQGYNTDNPLSQDDRKQMKAQHAYNIAAAGRR